MTGATGVIAKALFRASGNLPCRIIADANGPYLERYYLATVFGIRFYIHRFVASDPGRGLHDHPWPWAGSVVLSGFYFEMTRAGVRTVRWLNGLVGIVFTASFFPTNTDSLGTWKVHPPAFLSPAGRSFSIARSM